MERFVLDEVDYALQNGYSRGAKKHMVRNLHKKLDNHFQKLTYNDFKYDNVHYCITITYMVGMMLLYIVSVNNFGPPIKMLN